MPIGRCTKAYVGYDLESNRLVFIKDQWRSTAPGARSEVDVYRRLKECKVNSVATCLAGGDVVDSDESEPFRTISQKYQDVKDASVERVHVRLVLKEIGRPLESYPNSFALASLTYQALMGMCAYYLSIRTFY